MFRCLTVLAAVTIAIQCTSASGQGWCRRGGRSPGASISRGKHDGHAHHRRSYGYRSSYPSTAFGFGIGIGSYPSYGYSSFGYLDPYRFDGFGYDPYRYGSFRAPDLLDDPYFYNRHKFGSPYRPPLQLRSSLPVSSWHTYEGTAVQRDQYRDRPVLPAATDMAGQPRAATLQLSRSLGTRQGGDAWLEYLAPERITELIDDEDWEALRELLTRYDGVVSNPQLRSIADSNGFAATRNLLRATVNQRAGTASDTADQPAVETLPIPEPETGPDSDPEGTSQG